MSEVPGFEEVVKFHGHSCAGLAFGYRVVLVAMDALNIKRARDEELVAIVENNACGVDAIQYMLGCTFGKGNLIFRDYGKHNFTIMRRDTGEAVRIVADFLRPPEDPHMDYTAIKNRITEGMATDEDKSFWRRHQAAKIKLILTTPQEDFLTVQRVNIELPPTARVHESVRCDECGEKVMVTRTKTMDGERLCIPCQMKKQGQGPSD